MAIEISTFTGEHIDDAARLLAARHRADLEREPDLSPKFADVDAARDAVLEVLEAPGTRGTVAARGGRLVGYLLSTPQLPSPTSGLALAVPPRSVRIALAGHTVEPDEGADIYRSLYAGLSGHWVGAGYFSHNIGVPANDRQALDAWFSLGFGQDSAQGLRRTTPVEASAVGPGIEIRRAGPEDIDVVVDMVVANAAHHVAAPMFAPYLPEVFPDMREYHVSLLADPANAAWVAYHEGVPLGLQTFAAMRESLSTPANCVLLQNGYTVPPARGTGVATALLARSLEWARETGYERCTVGWLTSNPLSSRFWQRSGYRPVTYRLSRSVDRRIAWARP